MEIRRRITQTKIRSMELNKEKLDKTFEEMAKSENLNNDNQILPQITEEKNNDDDPLQKHKDKLKHIKNVQKKLRAQTPRGDSRMDSSSDISGYYVTGKPYGAEDGDTLQGKVMEHMTAKYNQVGGMTVDLINLPIVFCYGTNNDGMPAALFLVTEINFNLYKDTLRQTLIYQIYVEMSKSLEDDGNVQRVVEFAEKQQRIKETGTITAEKTEPQEDNQAKIKEFLKGQDDGFPICKLIARGDGKVVADLDAEPQLDDAYAIYLKLKEPGVEKML